MVLFLVKADRPTLWFCFYYKRELLTITDKNSEIMSKKFLAGKRPKINSILPDILNICRWSVITCE